MMKKGIVSGVAMIVVLSTILYPSTAMAKKVFIVGDDRGWRAGVDYQAWAANKFFTFNDFLIFNYEAGKDHAYEVDKDSFQRCRIPGTGGGGLGSGLDVVSLKSGGQKWFIGDHCEQGQKFSILVFGPFKPVPSAPAPSPASPH